MVTDSFWGKAKIVSNELAVRNYWPWIKRPFCTKLAIPMKLSLKKFSEYIFFPDSTNFAKVCKKCKEKTPNK